MEASKVKVYALKIELPHLLALLGNAEAASRRKGHGFFTQPDGCGPKTMGLNRLRTRSFAFQTDEPGPSNYP